MNLILYDGRGREVCKINLARDQHNRYITITQKQSGRVIIPLDNVYQLSDMIVAIKESTEHKNTQ